MSVVVQSNRNKEESHCEVRSQQRCDPYLSNGSVGRGVFRGRHFVVCALLALLFTGVLNVNLGAASENAGIGQNILSLIAVEPASNVVLCVEFLALYFFFRAIQSRDWMVDAGHKLSVALFSIVFALAWVVGYSCSVFSTPHAVFDGFLNIMASGVFSVAMASLVFFAVELLFGRLDGRRKRSRMTSGMHELPSALNALSDSLFRVAGPFFKILRSRPILVGALTYIILWSLLLLPYYPGMFAPGDTLNQISQFYGYSDPTSDAIVLLDPNVTLNTHHPVLHTTLMSVFVWLGQMLFSSANFGYFLYVIVQLVCVALTFGYVLSFCYRKNVDERIVVALYLFFAVFPWFSEYAVLGTKDTLFACALLLMSLSVLDLLTGEGFGKRDWIIFVVGIFGFCAFKKGYAIIVLLLAVLLGLFYRNRGRVVKASCVMGAIAVSSILVTALAFPILHISNGSPREALSIPIQQVARCVIAHEDDIADEQKEAIAKVFDYEQLISEYNPVLSDPVKNSFNKHATNDDIVNFLKTWLQLLRQYPETCVAATVMNYYQWFYPSKFATSYVEYNSGNAPMSSLDVHAETIGVSHPILESKSLGGGLARGVSKAYCLYQEIWAKAPFLSIATQAPTYVWLLLLSMLYLATRRKDALYAFLPTFFVLAVTLIGPCNYVVRYLFPLVFALVPLMMLVFRTPLRVLTSDNNSHSRVSR